MGSFCFEEECGQYSLEARQWRPEHFITWKNLMYSTVRTMYHQFKQIILKLPKNPMLPWCVFNMLVKSCRSATEICNYPCSCNFVLEKAFAFPRCLLLHINTTIVKCQHPFGHRRSIDEEGRTKDRLWH